MAPSLLLDTHALLWWLVEPEKLSSLALAAINDPAATIFVSAASGWELATKGRLGKLPGAEGLLQDLPSLLQQQGFLPLAVQLHHGVHAGGYRQAHRDPSAHHAIARPEPRMGGCPSDSADPPAAGAFRRAG